MKEAFVTAENIEIDQKNPKERAKEVLKNISKKEFMAKKQVAELKKRIHHSTDEEAEKIIEDLKTFYSAMDELNYMTRPTPSTRFSPGKRVSVSIPPKITKETAERLRKIMIKDYKKAKEVQGWQAAVNGLYVHFSVYEHFGLIHEEGGLEAIKKMISEHPEQADTIYNILERRLEEKRQEIKKKKQQENDRKELHQRMAAESILTEDLDKIA